MYQQYMPVGDHDLRELLGLNLDVDDIASSQIVPFAVAAAAPVAVEARAAPGPDRASVACSCRSKPNKTQTQIKRRCRQKLEKMKTLVEDTMIVKQKQNREWVAALDGIVMLRHGDTVRDTALPNQQQHHKRGCDLTFKTLLRIAQSATTVGCGTVSEVAFGKTISVSSIQRARIRIAAAMVPLAWRRMLKLVRDHVHASSPNSFLAMTSEPNVAVLSFKFDSTGHPARLKYSLPEPEPATTAVAVIPGRSESAMSTIAPEGLSRDSMTVQGPCK